MRLLSACFLALAPMIEAQPSTVVVTADDTVISKSCRIRIPPGTVIEDVKGDGVIKITASGIVVTFVEGSVLRGATGAVDPDQLRGVGIRIIGQKNVTLRDVRVSGFKVGLHASGTPGLAVSGGQFADNFRQRLRSTPDTEDESDWLRPHENDGNQWLEKYGAAVYVEDASNISLEGLHIRRGQNGILLDRVLGARIFDNDASFLSGWGLGLWRSSDNIITRNAFDFCVRGYSHGVYNRGQDSAGILMFEQCNHNVIAENSATHGGDGVFGFGGEEALKKAERIGNNGNQFIDNDFSYAAAHGLEMTFSIDNLIVCNRFIENAICGVWGGYSQDTTIRENRFERNGEMAYGLERGGINIEHGSGNRLENNHFIENKCGIHLWDDDDGQLLERPWAKVNHRGSRDNFIDGNRFGSDVIAIQLRSCGRTVLGTNIFEDVGQKLDADPESQAALERLEANEGAAPKTNRERFGKTTPVGARANLAGRQHIIMTEWGPWDHETPMARLSSTNADAHVYELHRFPERVRLGRLEPPLVPLLDPFSKESPRRLTVKASSPGAFPYRLSIGSSESTLEVWGTLINASWQLRVFSWREDPRSSEAAWIRASQSSNAARAIVPAIAFKFGHGGPSDLDIAPAITAAKLPADRFGLVAETMLPLKRGRWRVTTLSDDGVRVTVDRERIIDNWTHHAPVKDTGEFCLETDRAVKFLIEHFEIDGFATLSFELECVE